MRDIQGALNTYPNLPANYQGKALIDKWVNSLSGKHATDELSESDVRQLKMDLDTVMS